MAIITIARERGAYGRIVAKMLAERLSAHFIDYAVVDARLQAMGITEKKRTAFDERKPSFFAALTNAVEEYVCCLKQVMYEEAKTDSCVILGRGSQVLFADVPGAIRVRLVASPKCATSVSQRRKRLTSARRRNWSIALIMTAQASTAISSIRNGPIHPPTK